MIRPPNRIRKNLSASKLQQIKNNTRCLRCNKYGHLRDECTERDKYPMQNVVLNSIEQLGNSDLAVSKILLALVEDEEEYCAFINKLSEPGPNDRD